MTNARPALTPGLRYNIKQTCAILGICEDTLRKYSLEGRILRMVDAVGEIFYTAESITEFWDSCKYVAGAGRRRGRPPKYQPIS